MAKPLIIANWKMNPDAPGRATLLAHKIERAITPMKNIDVVIAPPFPFLLPVAAVLKHAKLGAQNVFWEDIGAYTGEVSWHQLKHLRADYVIVGHSERRLNLGETDKMINKKIRVLLENGIIPILCVGERERVGDDIPVIVGDQLEYALKGVKKEYVKNLVVAYEPVWAISTMSHAHPDSPENAFRAMIYIRQIISKLCGRACGQRIKVIYGGSVNEKNIRAFLVDGHMEGVLVGSASIDAKKFFMITHIANQL